GGNGGRSEEGRDESVTGTGRTRRPRGAGPTELPLLRLEVLDPVLQLAVLVLDLRDLVAKLAQVVAAVLARRDRRDRHAAGSPDATVELLRGLGLQRGDRALLATVRQDGDRRELRAKRPLGDELLELVADE